MRFKTFSGSVYEADVEGKKIRRLTGTEEPTTRQGADGAWKPFERLEVKVGECAFIFWNPETTPLLEGNTFGGVPATITSEVIEIEA